MANSRQIAWKKIKKGTSGLHVRVRDFVRKLRPERVRWQWRHLLASVDNHWPPSSTPERRADCDPEVAEATAPAQTRCEHDTAEQPMTSLTQLPEGSTDEELGRPAAVGGGGGGGGGGDGRGSVRPNELSLGGGSLVPPATTPRNKSPVTVQEWVDSLPLTPTETDGQVTDNRTEEEGEPRIVLTQDTDDNLTLGAEAGLMCGPLPPTVQVTSHREPSESGSHCSSVESLLEARRPDPEEVLLSLGFGGGAATSECRIPQRFLQPSKLKGVAIDDFLRHQQEMVTNFETGFCGYRGLSGPSHTMPSVIVAKIMEKLREHGRESCSAASPPPASTANTDRSRNNHHTHSRNRFSRAARNVITNLRSPGSSVLTPDNRAWLDSQNQRSPEVSRKRIIIGQQSFTFSRDGDLIESPPSSLTDSDSRWTSSTGPPSHHRADTSLSLTVDRPSFPSIEEAGEPPPPSPPTTTMPRHAFANVVTSLLAEKNQESKLSTSSVEARSVGDSGVGLPSSGRSSRGLDEFDSPVTDDSTAAPSVTVEHPLDSIQEAVARPELPGGRVRRVSESRASVMSDESDQSDGGPRVSKHREIEAGRTDDTGSHLNAQTQSTLDFESGNSSETCFNEAANCEVASYFNSLPVCTTSLSSDRVSEKSSSDSESDTDSFEKSKLPSEQSLVHPSPRSSADISTPHTSPFPNLASELEDVTQDRPPRPMTAPVRVIQSLDKVIESLEKIMEPLEVIAESELQFDSAACCQADKEKLIRSYEDLSSLARQLSEAGVPVDVGSIEHFISLTVNERCELQCRVVRQALSGYQSQLATDTSHYELRCCLGAEVTRLSDLLDTASDPDKLDTLVRQMTELLRHQAELTRELAQWTGQPAEESPGCHQLCEVVLRRLQALELLVHRNTRALSDLRNKVSH